MKIGDQVDGGIYAGSTDDHRIICSPIEYELPFEVDWRQAIDYCKALGMELPSKEELKLLYKLYKTSPNYFPNRKYHWYWSSNERSSTHAWRQSFDSGIQYATNKTTYYYYVRPIKRINI